MTCDRCGSEIVTLKGVSYEITGWEQPREAGGTNHVVERKRTGKIRCSTCTLKVKHGVTDDQLAFT